MRSVAELRQFVYAFVEDWKTAMLGLGSLLSPFLIFFIEHIYSNIPYVPNVVLFLVSILCVVVASYRVWRREHRQRLVQPLLTAKQELEILHRHWRKHEETYHKRNTVYKPLADPPGPNEWDQSNFNEYVDRGRMISEAEYFTRAVERAYEALPLLRMPEIAHLGYVQNRNNLTGNDLDQRIKDLNLVLDEAVETVRLGQSDPVPNGPKMLHRYGRM